MSDVNANIDINIDASQALAELKSLQRQISLFYTSINKGSATAAAAAQNMQRNLVNSINATGQFEARIRTISTASESFTTALEKNKLSMGEYFRYAGGASKTFGRFFKSEMDTIQKVAIDRVKTVQTQFIKLGRDANGAMKAIAVRPAALDMENYATKSMLAAQRQQIFNQLLKQGSTNLLNFGKNTQWAGRQLMVGFTVPLMYLGTVAGKTFMEMEQAAVKFRRVYGSMFTSSAETEKALKDIQMLANEFIKYGVAAVDTMEMAAKAAAMGKTGAELTAQVAEATRLAVLGAVEQEQALDTTISLTNAFGTAAADLRKEIDFLNAVENQTVVGIEDLTIAIPKAGPVIKQLGGDVKDLAFFLTAMKEGGINASEGANALKSGLASLINPTKSASEFLSSLGINIRAIVEGNAGDLKQTVIDFAFALDKLDPLNRARAIEQLFGKFQFARLSTLFQNVTKDGSQAAQVLDLAGKSVEELAILSERELGAIEQSTGTKFKAAVENLQKSLIPLGEQFLKIATPIAEFFTKVLDKFNNLSDGAKTAITAVIAIIGGLAPVALMTFGLLANGIANAIKFVLNLRAGYQRLTGQSKTLGMQTQYMSQEQLEANAIASSLDQTHARLTQTFTIEKGAVDALRQAYERAAIAGRNFAAANPGAILPGKPPIPRRFATGGTVPGPNVNKDVVPALLTPGEFVINRQATQKNLPLLQAINQNGTVPAEGIQRFNVGGLVQKMITGLRAKKVVPTQTHQIMSQQEKRELDLLRKNLTEGDWKAAKANLTPQQKKLLRNQVQPVQHDTMMYRGTKIAKKVLSTIRPGSIFSAGSGLQSFSQNESTGKLFASQHTVGLKNVSGGDYRLTPKIQRNWRPPNAPGYSSYGTNVQPRTLRQARKWSRKEYVKELGLWQMRSAGARKRKAQLQAELSRVLGSRPEDLIPIDKKQYLIGQQLRHDIKTQNMRGVNARNLTRTQLRAIAPGLPPPTLRQYGETLKQQMIKDLSEKLRLIGPLNEQGMLKGSQSLVELHRKNAMFYDQYVPALLKIFVRGGTRGINLGAGRALANRNVGGPSVYRHENEMLFNSPYYRALSMPTQTGQIATINAEMLGVKRFNKGGMVIPGFAERGAQVSTPFSQMELGTVGMHLTPEGYFPKGEVKRYTGYTIPGPQYMNNIANSVPFLQKHGYPLTHADLTRTILEVTKAAEQNLAQKKPIGNHLLTLEYLKQEATKFPSDKLYRQEMAKRWAWQTMTSQGISIDKNASQSTLKQYKQLVDLGKNMFINGDTETIQRKMFGREFESKGIVDRLYEQRGKKMAIYDENGKRIYAGTGFTDIGLGKKKNYQVSQYAKDRITKTRTLTGYGKIVAQSQHLQQGLNKLIKKSNYKGVAKFMQANLPDFSNQIVRIGNNKEFGGILPSWMGVSATSKGAKGRVFDVLFRGLLQQSDKAPSSVRLTPEQMTASNAALKSQVESALNNPVIQKELARAGLSSTEMLSFIKNTSKQLQATINRLLYSQARAKTKDTPNQMRNYLRMRVGKGRMMAMLGFNKGGMVSNQSGIIGNAGQPIPPGMSVVGGGPSDTRLIAVSPDELLFNRKDSKTIRQNARKSGIGIHSPLAALGATYPGLVPGYQNIPTRISVPGFATDGTQVQRRTTAYWQQIVDPQTGRTREDLARQSSMKLYGVDDPSKVTAEARAMRKLQESQAKALKNQIREMERNSQSTKQLTDSTDKTTKQSGNFAGKMGMASGAMMGVGMGAMMMGDKLGSAGQTIGQVAMGLSAVLGILPMLTGPVSISIAAFVAVAGALWFFDNQMKNAAKEASDLVDATSATTEKMKALGELTGKVGASEMMQRRRSMGAGLDKFTTGYDRAGQQFGTTFLESDVGKEISQNFLKDLDKNGEIAFKRFGVQLATYISDGVMTEDQAASIARSISVQVGDTTLQPKIIGEIAKIIGPGGSDFLKDPLKVRLEIIEQQSKVSNQLIQSVQPLIDDASNMVSNFFTGWIPWSDFRQNYAQLTIDAASVAAMGSQNLEIIQAQRDAQNKFYEDKIKELEAQKQLTNDKKEQEKIDTRIGKLKEQQFADDQRLAQARKNTIQEQIKFFNQINTDSMIQGGVLGSNKVLNSYIESQQQQIRKKYKGTGQETFVDSFITAAANTGGDGVSQLEIVMNAYVGSGDLTPQAATSLLNMFGEGEEAQLQTLLTTDIAMKDPGKFSQLTNLITSMFTGDKQQIGKSLLVDISSKDPKKFEDRVAVLNQLQTMDGREINVSAFLQTDGLAKIDQLSKLYNTIEGFDDITKKTIKTEINTEANGFGASGVDLKGMIDDWEFWGKLPDEEKKTAMQTYTAIYLSIGAEELLAERKRIDEKFGPQNPRQADSGTYVTPPKLKDLSDKELTQRLANRLAKQQYRISQWLNKQFGTDGTQTGGAGVSDSENLLDELLNKLKIVRDAALDTSMSWKELIKLLAKPGKISIFEGLDQKLTGKGFGEEFVNLITGMDKKEQKKYINIDKKTREVKLTKRGRAAKRGIDEITAGVFDVANKRILADNKNQEKSLKRLVSSGLSLGDAYKVVEDKALAAAIAGKQLTDKEIKRIVETLKLANKELELYNARLDIAKRGEEIEKKAKIPALIATAQVKLGRKLTQEEVQSIIDSEALQNLIGSDAVNQEELKAAIEQAGREAEVELQIRLSTEEGIIDTAQAGSNLANQIFSMYNDIAQSGVDLTNVTLPEADVANLPILQEMQGLYEGMEARTKQIAENNLKIAGIQETINQRQQVLNSMQDKLKALQDSVEINFDRPIEKYQDQISNLQRDIELQFTRPIEALQESLDDLSRQQELSFDRPIQALQEESTRLSNDLTIIDNAANKINEKYDKQAQALSKVAEINQEIVALEKSRITLADALTKGDISAAAQAAQDMRAQSATAAASEQSGVLDAARQAELDSLRSASGMTRQQIEERQYEIGQQVYVLEQGRLEIEKQKQIISDQIYALQEQSEAKQQQIRDIEDQIYTLEQARKVELDKIRDLEDQIKNYQETMLDPLQRQIDAINNQNSSLQYQNDLAQAQLDKLNDQLTVLGKTPAEWANIAAAIALANINSDAFLTTLKNALLALQQINNGEVTLPVQDGGGEPVAEPPAPLDPNKLKTSTLPDDVLRADQLDTLNNVKRVQITYKDGTTKEGFWDLIAKQWVKSFNDKTKSDWDPGFTIEQMAMGGMVPFMAMGGKMKRFGSDSVPAMLTPGEFVMRKKIVDQMGFSFFNDLNKGRFKGPLSKIMPPYQPPRFDDMQPRYRTGTTFTQPPASNLKTVYNSYSVNVNGANGNPNDIAKAVIREIRNIDSQKLRGQKL